MKEQILQALARGYCTPENKHKELDSTLINAMAEEVMKVLEWDGHKSDCAVHNMPAYPNGECDCGKQG